MSLGGNPQLLDMLCFAILHNAITAWHHGRATAAIGVAEGDDEPNTGFAGRLVSLQLRTRLLASAHERRIRPVGRN